MSLENKLDQATGAIKKDLVRVTGDSKTEAEGTVEKQLPKQKKLLKMLGAVEGAVEGLKIHLRRRPKKSRGMFP